MAFKYLGVKPPKVQHPTATELTEQLEHFRGALLETAEVMRDFDMLFDKSGVRNKMFFEKYPDFLKHSTPWIFSNIEQMLRVSAGETK